VLVIGFTFAVTPQSEIDNELEFVETNDDGGSINWTTQALRIKGNGFGPERIKSLGRRKILAKRAAKLDAYRNLIEVIKGVHITSNTTVEDMMLESDLIKSKTSGMLKGMKVIDVSYSDDGGCEITVEVNIGKDGDFLLTALNNSDVKVVDNYPKFDWVALRDELESTKIELASAKSVIKKTKNKLYFANLNLSRTKEKLKEANLSKADLKLTLEQTELELSKTSSVIDGLKDKLNEKNLKYAVNEKELQMTKEYLSERKTELAGIQGELHNYRENFQKASIDGAKLLGYVNRIKEVQAGTEQKMNSLYKQSNVGTDSTVMGSYSGLLIDVRSLNIKPVLAPSILDENNSKLYGIGTIPEDVSGGAIVDYIAGDLNKAKLYSKIGNNPLVVKGMKIVDKSNVMIRNDDKSKILDILNLLKQKKVAILL